VSLMLHAVWSPVVAGTTSRFYRISLDPTKPANYSELIKPRPCAVRALLQRQAICQCQQKGGRDEKDIRRVG